MTLKEQLYYVREVATEVAKYSLALDGERKAQLMQDEETRYLSTDLENAIRRMFGELDELSKCSEMETRRQAEGDKLAKEHELADKL